MSNSSCSVCQNPKAHLTCGLCEGVLCKKCVEVLEPDQFSYMSQVPQAATHSTYCRACYEAQVLPVIHTYDEVMARARDIRVYFKLQSQETRTIKRKARPVQVQDCVDYHEAVLRLAFLAAETGHNAIVDADIISRKVKNHSYQTTLWNGTAMPVHLDAKRLAREVPELDNPN